jgi:hypothetical protein
MMSEEKKQWERPQLVVLGRGTPEENVLQACKQVQKEVINPIAGKQNCKAHEDPPNCAECQKNTST